MHPLQQLQEIDKRSRKNAFALPQQLDVRETWNGIGFRIGEKKFVAAVSEIKEILPLPQLTPVFGAHSWVKGLANIRGTLLPIMDLRAFLLSDAEQPDRHARILAVQHGDIHVGLIVDEVLGLQHFYAEDFSADSGETEAALARHIRGTYHHQKSAWPVFNMAQLIASPEFKQVAA